MRNGLIFIFALLLSLLAACGNESGNNETNDEATVTESYSEDSDMLSTDLYNEKSEQQDIVPQENNDTSKNNNKIKSQIDRKVIYTADLQIEVKSYQKILNDIQTQVTKFQGYIVESNMYEDQENESKNGQVTARIPQEKFQEFIKLVEAGSSKVIESSTSGQDITEEYVDLESRLKSKQIVEKRLLSFMDQATKTEDLLNISSDLADVQEEIEEITGRLKYLQDKSDLATVTIHIQEKNVKISSTGKDQLNTWEQTKHQFMKSINFLITTFSNVFVILIGNLPILVLTGIIVLTVFLAARRRMKKQKKD